MSSGYTARGSPGTSQPVIRNPQGNRVESYICYLRRKLDRGEPRLIHTIRGIGYVLRVPPP